MERKATETKMVIVVRKDLCMTKGKYVAQGSHASLGLVLDMLKHEDEHTQAILEKWFSESSTKICVYVKSLDELHEVKNKAVEKGEAVKLITDSGLTMFHGEKTDTCLAILGYRNNVDEITGHLQLL